MQRTTTALTEKFVSGIDIASATGQGVPWIKLADELEQSEAFLRAIGDDELIKQTG